MIDKVTDYEPGVFASGYKNFTNNEWFFPAHFPGHANVPGVLQLEAMTQMMTVALTTLEGMEGTIPHGLNYSGEVKQEVLPGDRMDIHAVIHSWRRGICSGEARCEVDGITVSLGRMVIAVPSVLNSFLPKGTKSKNG